MEKRVVLEHTTGRFAHLWRIVGIVNQAEEQVLPSLVENIDLLDHFGNCGLVRVKPRYVLYREIYEPVKGKFNDFHPNQI